MVGSWKQSHPSHLLTFHSKLREPDDRIGGSVEFFKCILPQVAKPLPPHPAFPPVLRYHYFLSLQDRSLLYPPPLTHGVPYLLSRHLSRDLHPCYVSPSPSLYLYYVCVSRRSSVTTPRFSLVLPRLPRSHLPRSFLVNEVNPYRATLDREARRRATKPHLGSLDPQSRNRCKSRSQARYLYRHV